jgi:type III pantothenate kinase
MRFLADLGNARLKLARLGPTGEIAARAVVDTDRPETWEAALQEIEGLATDAEWAAASVRPEAARALEVLLDRGPVARVGWFRSVADTPVRHRLAHPETCGADRALAVLGWGESQRQSMCGVVVMCGTAITVERIEPDGIWAGGAIAPGWRPLTQALHDVTAQLPRVEPPSGLSGSPFASETRSALEAGLRGMIVGGCRELIRAIREGLPASAVTVWTGGDAPWLAAAVEGASARIEPDLVMRGLATATGWSA